MERRKHPSRDIGAEVRRLKISRVDEREVVAIGPSDGGHFQHAHQGTLRSPHPLPDPLSEFSCCNLTHAHVLLLRCLLPAEIFHGSKDPSFGVYRTLGGESDGDREGASEQRVRV